MGSSVQGHNLFAYCENDPVNKVDPAGHFASEIWEFARIAGYEISANMGALTPAYAGCAGAAAVDGPLPIGDVICIVGVATLTVGAVGYGVYQATQDPSISFSKPQKKIGKRSPTLDENEDSLDDESSRTTRVGRRRGNTPGSNQKQNKQAKN